MDLHNHDSSSESHNEAEDFIYYVLFSNMVGQSPLSLALKKYAKPQIETMIEILGLSHASYDYFKHLKVYFIQLLEMKSEVFESFFDRCHIETVKMHIKTDINFEKGPVYLQTHS